MDTCIMKKHNGEDALIDEMGDVYIPVENVGFNDDEWTWLFQLVSGGDEPLIFLEANDRKFIKVDSVLFMLNTASVKCTALLTLVEEKDITNKELVNLIRDDTIPTAMKEWKRWGKELASKGDI